MKRILFVLGVAAALCMPQSALSVPPPAGTSIQNVAAATYVNSGGPQAINTNTVQITVGQVASFTLTASQTRTAVPSSTVYFPHTLTNTGNGADTFDLSFTNDAGTFNFTSIVLHIDADGNGVPDNLVPLASTGSIASGAQFRFVVAAAVPAAAIAGQTDQLTVRASGNAAAAATGGYVAAALQTNIDTANAISAAILTVTKSLNVTSGPSPNTNGGNHITITLQYVNSGATAATNFVLSDVIGLVGVGFNTQAFAYVPGSAQWNGAPLTDAAGGDPAGLNYDFDQTTASTARAVIASVAPAQSGTLTLKFDVLPGFAAGTAFSTNLASYSYHNGIAAQNANTNSAAYTVVGSAAGADLTLAKTHNGDFAVENNNTYALVVRNIGNQSSAGAITVTDTLPAGLAFVAAGSGGTGWACSAVSQVVTCTSSAAVPAQVGATAGVHPNPLTIVVRPQAASFPTLPSNVINNAAVAGGAEPAANNGNNSATDATVIQAAARLAGRAWHDANHNRIYEPATEASLNLPGWIVELCPAAAAVCDASTRIAATTTQADGTYVIANLAAGSYKVQFRDPTNNLVHGAPKNGEFGTPQPGSTEDPQLRYLFVTLAPGDNLQQQSLPLDPSGIVYDSITRAPLAGATVTLSGPVGFEPFLLGGATNATQVTSANGFYQFLLTPGFPVGAYSIAVTPPAGYENAPSRLFPAQPVALDPPAGCTFASPTVCSVDPANLIAPPPNPTLPFYFLSFQLNGGDPDIVNNHVPLDPLGAAASSGLLVAKTAARELVELGDFIDYTVRVQNAAPTAFSNVVLRDTLPFGFTYVKGSARRDGAPMAEPQISQAALVFVVGTLESGITAAITYRVKVGAGAQLGDGINRAQASSGQAASNVASVRVRVQGGVLSDRAFILGKVYLDCNANGVQNAGESGVPGVRLFLEDGSIAITDSEGKYSLYGILPRTHVLKIDSTTLPAGTTPIVIANRQALDARSRFVDLKGGELHRADFALGGCGADVIADVDKRRAKGEINVAETARVLERRLEADARGIETPDPRSLPATGKLGDASAVSPAPSAPTLSLSPTAPILPAAPAPSINAGVASLPAPPVARVPSVALETLIPDLDNALGFIDLKDGATLPIAQANVRVKGPLGASLQLTLNGSEVPLTRVGKRSKLEDKQIEAWEYIGVDLKPGENVLTVSTIDPFGNARGSQTIKLIAPAGLGKVVLDAPAEAAADGTTPLKIRVRLTDSNGVPVTVRTALTLEAKRGRWQADDLDKVEPGVQVFIEGGHAEFLLLPPQEPGDDLIRVSSGVLKGERTIVYLPDLRPLVGAGVIEGAINLRKLSLKDLSPARENDSFEREIQRWSTSANDGKLDAGGRAALFLKGVVKGDFLLTLAYDSDKDLHERLFRDIQPDQFYPVYGDSSLKLFDAQSTERLYVRIDKGRSFLLYGDYTTQTTTEARKLSQYSRSLTGIKHHYETGRLNVNAFASQDTFRQSIEEFPANGTSGPFQLNARGLINSEKVEILTRDRDQPSVILKAEPQARFADYEIEPFSGRILFKAPIASFDFNLNPKSIRVTYEVDQGGDKFWIYGADAQFKLTDAIEVGGNYVRDENPLAQYQLGGANGTIKFGERTFLFGELAHTEKELVGAGNAGRVEMRHDDERIAARAFYAKSDNQFDNPSAALGKGRTEAAASVAVKVAPNTVLAAEALLSEDEATGGERRGVLAKVEQTFGNGVKAELGVRHSTETAQPAQANTVGATPIELTSVRAKVTAPVPYVPLASVFGEYEQDIDESDKKLAALGGEYQFANRGKIYARHELLSSLGSPFALNPTQRRATSLVGIETEYLKDKSLFSEYRLRDALDGRAAEAAVGLRNGWTIAEGLKLHTTLERVHTLSKSNPAMVDGESNAYTGAIEYTASSLWKGSARIEYRDATESESWLGTVGGAFKLNRDWTALARAIYSTIESDGLVASERTFARYQLGAAYRDTATNVWNALGRIEHRLERDTSQATAPQDRELSIFSLHANYQPSRTWVATGRYAAKLVHEDSLGIASRALTHLASSRLTVDIHRDWDIGVQASVLSGSGGRQYGAGAEVGYLLRQNLWLSVGYNFFGFKDKDLADADYLQRGVFFRLRFKFDESLFAFATPSSQGGAQ